MDIVGDFIDKIGSIYFVSKNVNNIIGTILSVLLIYKTFYNGFC